MLTALCLIRRRRNPLALALLTALVLVGCIPFHQVPVSPSPDGTGPAPADCAKYSAAAGGWNLVDNQVRLQLERWRLSACASSESATVPAIPESTPAPGPLWAPAPGAAGSTAPACAPGAELSPPPATP